MGKNAVIDEFEDGGATSEPNPAAQQPATLKPEETVEHWRSKYNGQQGFVSQLRQRMETAEQTAAQLAQQYETELASIKAQRDEHAQQLAAAREENERLAAVANQASRTREISALIDSDFDVLRSQLDQDDIDLLATRFTAGKDEELRAFLERKAQKLQTTVETQTRQRVAGSVPPAPGVAAGSKTAKMTRSEALANLNSAMRHGLNSPEYRRAMDEYLAIVPGAGKGS